MAKWLMYIVGLSALFGCASTAPHELHDAAQGVEDADIEDVDAHEANVEDAAQPTPQDAGARDAGSPMRKSRDTAAHSGSGLTPTCDEARCVTAAAEFVAKLKAPTIGWQTFVGGSCKMVGVDDIPAGPTCECETDGDGSIYLGPKGLGCFYYGRAGDCLWRDSDYQPCTPDKDTCPAVCKELEARLEADAKRTFEAEARSSKCGEDGFCRNVVRVEDRCYADLSMNNPHAYDCSLSNEEVLAADAIAKSPPILSCNDPAFHGGVCEDDTPPPSADECAPRPKSEWQGLLVCPPYLPCEESARCGLALACIDRTCQACTSDDQCATGEGCALDHCMPQKQISCHVTGDCKKGQVCILSGYTGGTARSNEDMRAYCLDIDGGTPQEP